jgi:FSR family fosmidomycin resistance protein-like MFS transporter
MLLSAAADDKTAASVFPWTLVWLSLAHGVVDTFAAVVNPLWPDLRDHLQIGDAGIQWAYAVWTLAASITQVAFGYWGDRNRGRWLIWAGPAIGIVCLCLLGWVHSLLALSWLLVFGGLGIAAFHPEGAARAGASWPGHRSRAVSIFAVGGFLGQALGPLISGYISDTYGMAALAWCIPIGLALMFLLMLGTRRAMATSIPSHPAPRVSLATLFAGRKLGASLMLAIGTLRTIPSLGVPLGMAFLMKANGASNEAIGGMQSMFLLGIGIGNLGCAIFIRHHWERQAMWALPLIAVPLLFLCPTASFLPLLSYVFIIGFVLGATLPVLISYGQQLLPEGQRTANSISMGVTWGLGGAILAGVLAAVAPEKHALPIFSFFAVVLVLSSLCCLWLPEPAVRR